WSNGQVLSATPSHPWAKIDAGETGRQALERALSRFLIVFPWNQRYFAAFGNLSTAAAVMGGLEKAVKNLDDIKNTYKSLSVMHSEKLHVDPDNFRVCSFLLKSSVRFWLPRLALPSSPRCPGGLAQVPECGRLCTGQYH
uniref:Globin domain-containing protein n=1 Tax=Monopterus albus TaxID=43700 RepID=A0A3Q3K7L6_MONAL